MAKRVLLSIKPVYADQIFDGTKLYEFRRVIFKDPNVKTVVVYASTPVKKVIGEFSLEKVITLKKEQLWKLTRSYAGIDKNGYDLYFADKEYATALKVKKARRYKKPLCLKIDFKISHAPQSFVYLLDEDV